MRTFPLTSEREKVYQALTKSSTRRVLLGVEEMTNLLRDYHELRELDGAVAWRKLISKGSLVRNKLGHAAVEFLITGTRKRRFEHCLKQRDKIQHLRALQGHFRGVRVDPTLQIRVLIPHGWTDCIFTSDEFGSTPSNVDSGLLTGGRGHNQGTHMLLYSSEPIMRVWRRSIV